MLVESYYTYQVDNLRLTQLILAEMGEELRDFNRIAAEEVREVQEYFVDDLCGRKAVIQLKEKQNFLHALVQLHREELGTVENQFHALSGRQSTLLLQKVEDGLNMVGLFAKNHWVLNNQRAEQFFGEAMLINEQFLEGNHARFRMLWHLLPHQKRWFVTRNKADFLFCETELTFRLVNELVNFFS